MKYILLITLLSLNLIANDINKGSFNFTPYINSYNEYNSNFFSTTKDETAVVMLKLLPGMKLENRNKRDKEISFDLNASYKYFISLNDNFDALVEENRDFDLNAKLNIALFKEGNFSLYFGDDFSKLSYSGYTKPLQKIANNLTAGVQTTPFGRALMFRLGYRFGFNKTLFTDDLGSYTKLAAEAQDNMEHDFNLDIEWKFLPKTSFISTTTYGFIQHYNANSQTVVSLNVVDSNPISSKIGLLGVITPKLAVKLLLGWSYVIYDSGNNFNSFVSNLELTYSFTKKTNLTFGFENSFRDVVFSNYLSYYDLYLKLDMMLTNNLTFGVNVDTVLNLYSGVSLGSDVESPDSRTEFNTNLETFLKYKYREKYKMELKYSMTKIFTDFTTTYAGEKIEYDYLKHVVSLNFYISF